MREEFYEWSVGPTKDQREKTLLSICNVLFVITILTFSILLFLLFLTFDSGFIVLTIANALFGVALFFLKRRLYTFYDYTYISGEVRIIKLINGKTRRRFLIFDCKDVKLLGKVGSGTYDSLMNSTNYKVKMATPNGYRSENQLYYVNLNNNGENILLILECDEKFLSYIVSTRGKTIVEKDYK